MLAARILIESGAEDLLGREDTMTHVQKTWLQ